MKLNVDLSQLVLVCYSEGEWVLLLLVGVEWCMFDCDGDEVVCVMSFVCYVLGSSFFVYMYLGGEEYFVFEGIFLDELGDYLVGSYVYNLVGLLYMLCSDEGCVIFVKLYWMYLDDQQIVRILMVGEDFWQLNGDVECLFLYEFGVE